MSETISKRRWENLSPEAFKKIQDLEAVVANNKETMVALDEAINVHKDGLELLNTDSVEPIRVQFQTIIENFNKSYENLAKYNMEAENLLSYLESEYDVNTLLIVETLLKIVAFK